MRALLLAFLCLSAPAHADDKEKLYWRALLFLHPYMAPANQKPRPVDLHKLDRALARLERVVAMDPKSWPAFMLLGLGYRARKDWQRSYDRFARAWALQPENPNTGLEFSGACMLLGRSEEALRAARQAIAADKLDDYEGTLHANLALALLIAGRVDEALATARATAQRNPSDDHTEMVRVIEQVKAGKRPPPRDLRELVGI
jgi:tetratricopeptide (TPR) repeat protein